MRTFPTLLISFLLGVVSCAGPVAQYPDVTPASVVEEQADVQRGIILRYMAQQSRVASVSWPILIENVELCGSAIRESFGLRFGNNKTLRRELDGFSLSQIDALGYGPAPIIFSVAANSPADQAGLKPGMTIDAIGEIQINGNFETLADALQLRVRASRASAGPVPLPITATLGEETISAELMPQNICSPNITVRNRNIINAAAGDHEISIFTGLLDRLREDDELAVVIGHELAHVTGRHVRKSQGNSTKTGYAVWGVPVGLMAGLVDSVVGVPLEAFAGVETPPGQRLITRLNNQIIGIQGFEREADYVGLYFTHRGGYDISNAENTFRQLSLLSPRATYGERTHPTTPERIKALALTRAEIERKIAEGKPLIPNGIPIPPAYADWEAKDHIPDAAVGPDSDKPDLEKTTLPVEDDHRTHANEPQLSNLPAQSSN